jgi:multidrug efflux pump subunit AcrA (membrane-fusion protein)
MRLLVLLFIFIFSINSASNAENRDARALVTATQIVTISSELAARVEKINFLLGDAFKKGDTLISFECELIIAPYDGKVMNVGTSIFTSIEQRQPLMSIVGDGLLEADIVVPSNWLKWLKKGHEVKITIDETGETLDATVIKLGATVDAVSQTIELKAQFNKKYETLIPGMSGIVKF